MRTAAVSPGGIDCTSYQKLSDCNPSTIANVTANMKAQSGGAWPPNIITAAMSTPNTAHTDK